MTSKFHPKCITEVKQDRRIHVNTQLYLRSSIRASWSHCWSWLYRSHSKLLQHHLCMNANVTVLSDFTPITPNALEDLICYRETRLCSNNPVRVHLPITACSLHSPVCNAPAYKQLFSHQLFVSLNAEEKCGVMKRSYCCYHLDDDVPPTELHQEFNSFYTTATYKRRGYTFLKKTRYIFYLFKVTL